MVSSVRVCPRWQSCLWYQCTTGACSAKGITILSALIIKVPVRPAVVKVRRLYVLLFFTFWEEFIILLLIFHNELVAQQICLNVFFIQRKMIHLVVVIVVFESAESQLATTLLTPGKQISLGPNSSISNLPQNCVIYTLNSCGLYKPIFFVQVEYFLILLMFLLQLQFLIQSQCIVFDLNLNFCYETQLVYYFD